MQTIRLYGRYSKITDNSTVYLTTDVCLHFISLYGFYGMF